MWEKISDYVCLVGAVSWLVWGIYEFITARRRYHQLQKMKEGENGN